MTLPSARIIIWRHRRPIGAALALVALNRAAALVLPLGARWLVDGVILQRRGALLAPLALAMAAALVTESASALALARVTGIGAQRAVTALRRRLLARVVRLPAAAHDRMHAGALVARVMADSEQLRGAAGPGLTQLASAALTGVFALAILCTISARLAAALLLLLAALAAGAAIGLRWLHAAYRAASAAHAALCARLTESLGGARVVKACAAERGETRTLAGHAHALLRAGVRAHAGASALSAGTTLVAGGASLLVLVAGARAVPRGTMTLGELVLCASLAGMLVAPATQAAAMAGELARALAALARLRDLCGIATEDEEDAARGARPVPRVHGSVAFREVTHAYAPGRVALRDVDFTTLAGSCTALVGRSGSGKSTLCRLVLALDHPTRGSVLVDGRDLALLRRTAYRRHVGVVPQDGFLFDTSVAENVRWARPGATMAEVRAAGRLAQCEELVDRLPRGWETPVGERGLALSGGERQRVAIARALLANPRILILDEATAHLDAESEALVRSALLALMRARTTFVVAHGAGLVEHADQILVLEQGQVAARGTHAELLAGCATYRRLIGRGEDAPREVQRAG
ncbi:MAG TPA: ABC transporter ATP-binding protein [Gemmatimonadaceae bacterium]|nr:ABC transporter ATP-binding protein [Gemmatimonadaceae bacterium]